MITYNNFVSNICNYASDQNLVDGGESLYNKVTYYDYLIFIKSYFLLAIKVICKMIELHQNAFAFVLNNQAL